MRIVIDLQGAQGTSRTRGIGRYSMALALAIAREHGNHEILLALNGLLTHAIEPIRAEFAELLPPENIRIWEAPGPVSFGSPENDGRRLAAELIREEFLASLEPDIVLVSSLFEGWDQDVVTSIGMLDRTVPTAVILYDLIPLVYRHLYLQEPVVTAWYNNKLEHLRRANVLLAISESSRQDAIINLEFPARAAFNIAAAADAQFAPEQVSRARQAEIRERYGLQRPFAMYTGGIDARKNIEGLIRAYAKLPRRTRERHQLAIVCAIQPPSRSALEALARSQGLADDELVLTGFVPDEDLVTLYNLCKVFVFPSLYEGFGLPPLEAMACGRAVIASDSSSLPEVVGRPEMRFDPRSDDSIAGKLAQVLTDDALRAELEQYGLEQSRQFSWATSARRAIAALEACPKVPAIAPAVRPTARRRPTLAYVSPLPPQRSGISDYSAELLPQLARHYDMDVIVAQDAVSDPWIVEHCPARDVDWFRSNAHRYDRVLYHIGNSPAHQHMFKLLEDVPGVVVLHDFYLAHIVEHIEVSGDRPGFWGETLYRSHGYGALAERCQATDPVEFVWRYPCNLDVLQQARGVIVHSDYSRRLAKQWYGSEAADDWAVIPLLRAPVSAMDRAEARQVLDLDPEAFVVCSFGRVQMSKLSHRLLDAWLASPLAQDPRCILVFVGESPADPYCAQLRDFIQRSGLGERVRITGWVDPATYRRYLAVGDAAVQLRTLSRGETSAAVLDCMNYGLATVINANGSNADFPDDAVWKLPDEFLDSDLAGALERIWQDRAVRENLGARARHIVHTQHAPERCAELYRQAIEAAYQAPAAAPGQPAQAGDATAPHRAPRPVVQQVLLDISTLVQTDAKSGIQRVVRSILRELLLHPPAGCRVEPVYAIGDQPYRYARRFSLGFLDVPETGLQDEEIQFRAGDVFLGLDLAHGPVLEHRGLFQRMRSAGVKVEFVVYDLLPVLFPDKFHPNMEALHRAWLEDITEYDGVVCISQAVAKELEQWKQTNKGASNGRFRIDWFHLGADIEASSPTRGMPEGARDLLDILASEPGFLMVGTLEPRKGYAQTLAAFDQLWAEGYELNLVIVGKYGWNVDEVADHIRTHPLLGKLLFWLEGISDEYLEALYGSCVAVIAASEGEGFGLPIIEAAQHQVSIIARDLPVFREVAGDHAFYFSGSDPCAMADALKRWLALFAERQEPQPGQIQSLTWAQSARQLMQRVLEPGR